MGFAMFSWTWLFCRHKHGRIGWWHITALDPFSPQKGSQEVLPKTESRGFVVRSQWSGSSRNPSSRVPSAEEARSKTSNLKVEIGMKDGVHDSIIATTVTIILMMMAKNC